MRVRLSKLLIGCVFVFAAQFKFLSTAYAQSAPRIEPMPIVPDLSELLGILTRSQCRLTR